MPGLVHGRAHQVVHRGVDDCEVPVAVALEHLDAGQQQAGVADHGPSEFEEHLGALRRRQAALDDPGIDALEDRGEHRAARRRRLVAVGDAQAAAQIEMPDDDALGGKLVGQVEDAVECREEGLDFGDLRADMAVDAFDAQVGQLPGLPIGRQRAVVGDAELVVAQAGRDIGVRAGIDIGVDPQRDRGRQAE